MSNETYWLHKDASDVVSQLQDVRGRWGLWSSSPFRQAWVRNVIAYYSPVIYPTGWFTSLSFEGIQGELVRMFTPQARSMVRQLVTLVTKQKISAQALAMSEGGDVTRAVKLGNAIFDQIIEDQRLESKKDPLTECAIVCGAAFTYTRWRTDQGIPRIRDEEGRLIYDGAVEISVHEPFAVVYDATMPSWDAVPWVEVQTLKNRFDLIAQFPELETEILAVAPAYRASATSIWFERVNMSDDMIFCFEFYARPSAALPQGRMIMAAADDCVFFDDINHYGTLPVEPMMPETVTGSTIGYPSFTNLMACQEMFDNSLSAIATNQAQFAVQSLTTARGSNIGVTEVGGMRFIQYTPQNVPGGGKPEPLQLTASSPETFKFADMLKDNMMEMSNINGALRGTPPAGATSGVAIATLSANALEMTTSIQRALNVCLEKTLGHAMNCYQKFAKIPKLATVQGGQNQTYQKPYTSEDLMPISGVKVNVTNPLMQTVAGRIEIAEKLLQMPREMWGKYTSILEGQPLTKLYEDELSEDDLIDGENDALSNGQPAPTLITDDHAKHIQCHAALLNDPKIRLNGEFNQVILTHIQEHYRLEMEKDPMLTAMVRTGKAPEGMGPPPMGGPPPPGPGGPVGGGPGGGMPQMNTAAPADDMLEGAR